MAPSAFAGEFFWRLRRPNGEGGDASKIGNRWHDIQLEEGNPQPHPDLSIRLGKWILGWGRCKSGRTWMSLSPERTQGAKSTICRGWNLLVRICTGDTTLPIADRWNKTTCTNGRTSRFWTSRTSECLPCKSLWTWRRRTWTGTCNPRRIRHRRLLRPKKGTFIFRVHGALLVHVQMPFHVNRPCRFGVRICVDRLVPQTIIPATCTIACCTVLY